MKRDFKMQSGDYEVSDSDDGFGEEDKVMLDRAKQGKLINDESEVCLISKFFVKLLRASLGDLPLN